MNATSKPLAHAFHAGWASYAKAYADLTKLKISVMVLFTFCVAGVLAAGLSVDMMALFYATLGMLLIASSGNAMNMYLERYTDFLMPRTASRPLPAQRLSSTEVVLFASICFGVSLVIFLTLVNWQTAVCGVATWVLYVWIYTPLKTRTVYNTEIGAVPGALPILMGSLATTATVTWINWSFFLVLLVWQFPHFMSIAWLYREQYRKGGLQMITVADPSGRSAGRKAVGFCLLMIALSLLPIVTFDTWVHGLVFSILALALSWPYLSASIVFAKQRDDLTARRLLKTSVMYLPMYMLLVILGSLI